MGYYQKLKSFINAYSLNNLIAHCESFIKNFAQSSLGGGGIFAYLIWILFLFAVTIFLKFLYFLKNFLKNISELLKNIFRFLRALLTISMGEISIYWENINSLRRALKGNFENIIENMMIGIENLYGKIMEDTYEEKNTVVLNSHPITTLFLMLYWIFLFVLSIVVSILLIVSFLTPFPFVHQSIRRLIFGVENMVVKNSSRNPQKKKSNPETISKSFSHKSRGRGMESRPTRNSPTNFDEHQSSYRESDSDAGYQQQQALKFSLNKPAQNREYNDPRDLDQQDFSDRSSSNVNPPSPRDNYVQTRSSPTNLGEDCDERQSGYREPDSDVGYQQQQDLKFSLNKPAQNREYNDPRDLDQQDFSDRSSINVNPPSPRDNYVQTSLPQARVNRGQLTENLAIQSYQSKSYSSLEASTVDYYSAIPESVTRNRADWANPLDLVEFLDGLFWIVEASERNLLFPNPRMRIEKIRIRGIEYFFETNFTDDNYHSFTVDAPAYVELVSGKWVRVRKGKITFFY